MKKRLFSSFLLVVSLLFPLFFSCVQKVPADTAQTATEAATAAERDAVTFPAGTEAPDTTGAPETTSAETTGAPKTTEPATDPVTGPPQTEPATEPVTEPPQTEPVTEPVTEPPVTTAAETEDPNAIVALSPSFLPSLSYMSNPYSSITKIGDPYILYTGGAYYMYATSGMQCWRSTNLKN